MDFTVKRKTWARGLQGATYLLDKDTKMMCCLGHCAKNLEVPDAELEDIPIPGKMNSNSNTDAYLKIFGDTNRDLAWDAADINDKQNTPDNEREAQLTALFSKHGHTMKFED